MSIIKGKLFVIFRVIYSSAMNIFLLSARPALTDRIFYLVPVYPYTFINLPQIRRACMIGDCKCANLFAFSGGEAF